jgi:PAS domain S-box-containing protein
MQNIDSIPEIVRIFDDASDFIFLVDQEFRIVFANKSFLEMLGKADDQILGKKCYEVIHGTAEPTLACPHAQAKAGPGSIVQQVFGSRRGIHVLLSVLPIFAETDQLNATIHVGRVINSERRKHSTGIDGESGKDKGTIALSLTPRQQKVLELLSEGFSSKEIAFKLGVSPRTIEFHKRELLAKVNVRTLAGLIRFAFLENIIS